MKQAQKLLALVCATLLLVSTLAAVWGSAQALEKEKITVTAISDTHFFAEKDMNGRSPAWQAYDAGSNRQYGQIGSILESALAAVAADAQKSALPYLFLSGDLARDGEYNAQIELAERMERFEQETGITVFVTNGNHDINNSGAMTFENGKQEKGRKTTPEEFRSIYANLGYDEADSFYTPPGGKKGGMLSYAADLRGGYRLIVLDTGKYSPDTTESGTSEHETGGSIPAELLTWALAECAKANAKGQTIIGMMHHNIAPHNGLEPIIFKDFVLDDWQARGAALADAGMKLVFTGHYHMNDTAGLSGKTGAVLYDIMTSSLENFPNQFREVTLDNTGAAFSAYVDSIDADRDVPIQVDGIAQAKPYKYSYSFQKTFGEFNLTDIAGKYLESALRKQIRTVTQAGGILNALKANGTDVEELLTGALGPQLGGGFVRFLADLCAQLETEFLNDAYLHTLTQRVLTAFLQMQVSDLPCTAFINSVGFGDPNKPGTAQDLALSTLAYIYQGNENPQADAFYMDALKRFKNGGGNALLALLQKELLTDFLGGEVLAALKFNPALLTENEQVAKVLDEITNTLLGEDTSYLNLWNTLTGGKKLNVPKGTLDPFGFAFASLVELFVFDKTQDYGMTLTFAAEKTVQTTAATTVPATQEASSDVQPTQQGALPTQVEVQNVDDVALESAAAPPQIAAAQQASRVAPAAILPPLAVLMLILASAGIWIVRNKRRHGAE